MTSLKADPLLVSPKIFKNGGSASLPIDIDVGMKMLNFIIRG